MARMREVAWRVFADEFNSSSVEMRDEGEYAPAYVLTPLGALVNRVYAVGVLTEVENIGTEEAREVSVTFAADPAGAMVPLDAPIVASSLAPGEEMRVEARYGAEAGGGLYSFRVTADPENVISELDERDNALRAELRLP